MEFWESSFIEKQNRWGFEPADAAIVAKDFFKQQGIKDVLIPGIGYGRNARVFQESGIKVTGIEISETAINLAKSHLGTAIPIHHGSVTDMPFDNKLYGGIFCYALIHLLDLPERKKFIRDCYNQLEAGGYMIFTAVSVKASMFGTGKELGRNWFEIMEGVKMFFYDAEAVEQEFGDFGLTEFTEIDEPVKNMGNKPPLKLMLIKCRKAAI